MQRHLTGLLVGVAIAGCGTDARPHAVDASIDAEPDALPEPRNDPGTGPHNQTFEARFVTPEGTFDAQYLFALSVGGDCNPHWELMFSTTENGSGPTVGLMIVLPPYAGVEVSGTMTAGAYFLSSEPLVSHSTQDVTFEATRIDYPGNGAPRLTGRFSTTDPAWTLDLDVDVLAATAGCI